ncbi:MAG: crossover junction endodeoxyribonuclease RuvC [Candidatus Levybacteria bacterium]|nr:crossover junction endodeoxyribonuclease RuvC [Candidatus Levybacteria bacterium]
MRIIGIDPGLGRLGWGVVQSVSNRQIAIRYGCIETDKDTPEEKRIEEVYSQLKAVIDELRPEALAVEQLFFGRNVTTAFMVGQARGVVLLLAAQSQIPVFEYNPGEIKVAVTGYGKADKNQIGQMVKAILKLSEIPRLDDTTDALAIALTHSFTHRATK